MTIAPLGDSAVVISIGSGLDEALLASVRAIASMLECDPPPGTMDIVPAFATITMFYDLPNTGGFAHFCVEIEKRVNKAGAIFSAAAARIVDIPVCYGGEFGPDLHDVAVHSGLNSPEVVTLHSGGNYVVQAIGFAPGFGYLGGLAKRIHAPRRATPRTLVPAGSVGIGGTLSAVYPFATPGGWNIIGRTPLKMFDPTRAEPAILHAGDLVRFRVITEEEFAAWR
jgi:inhibitor of KinA